MGRNKVQVSQQIPDETFRRITYSKRKKGIIKKAFELSQLCGQQIMLAIYNNTNNKLVIYQSTKEFNPTKVNELLSSEDTKTLYEEHTNADFHQKGHQKQQTFDLRHDNNQGTSVVGTTKKRKTIKKHWKI